MKTLYWGVAMGLLLAQGTGDLIVVSETGEPFRLYVNGEWIAETPVTRAEAHDLHEGPQKGTVYIHPSEGRVIQLKKTFYVESGYVEYYAIRKQKGQYKVVQYNRVPRSEEQAPATAAQPATPPASPQTTPPAQPNPPANTGGGAVEQNTQNQNQNTTIVFNPTIQVNTGSGTQVAVPPAPQPPVGTPVPPVPGMPPSTSTYSGPCNCTVPMSRESFQQALATLRNETFDQTRLEMAKQIARQNCLLAQDVREIMKLFDFESSKLEFAKFAYDYTHDLSNYFVVNESFDFSSSKDELVKYIQTRPARQRCQAGTGWPSTGAQPSTAVSRPCTPCMPAGSFSQALTTLKNAYSDPTRLEIARQIIATNCLSAEQVREVCRTFYGEPLRLQIAKEAYTRCCDPQNYFVVNQAFMSSASQQELAQYIQQLSGR